jgi:hypothetical protein
MSKILSLQMLTPFASNQEPEQILASSASGICPVADAESLSQFQLE